MSRRSAYEQRDLDRGGHTVVVQDGGILGVLDSRGELVRLNEPPADRPDLWPEEWWTPIGEISDWR